MTVVPSVPPSLGWELKKKRGTYVYDAVVGEELLMCGRYPHLSAAPDSDEPLFFTAYEVYERVIQRLLHGIPGFPGRRYPSIPCYRTAAIRLPTFVGFPGIGAPSPFHRRGVMRTRFEDNLGFDSSAPLISAFAGTAISTFDPHVAVDTNGAELGVGKIEKTLVTRPVREDPVVTVRPIVGDELADYLEEYISATLAFLSPRGIEDYVGLERDRILRLARNSQPEITFRELVVERDLDPGDVIITHVSIQLERGAQGLVALRTDTGVGTTMSDVLEIRVEEDGEVLVG